jgi:hypothetical protein
MNDEPTQAGSDGDHDQDLGALLRAVGPRVQPTAEMTRQVRAAVEAEWRNTVAARQPRRRFTPWLAAASVAALAVGAWLVAPQVMQGSASIASVARVTGGVEYRVDQDGAWQPLQVASTLRPGAEIRTAADGRVALHLADGLDLRLDAATTLAMDDRETAQLAAGRVYVDAGAAGAASRDFTIATALGDVRHLGTQYMAGLDRGGGLTVAVREGSVAVAGGREPLIARAGESITLGHDGRIARGIVAGQDEQWAWAQAIVPEFSIEGRSLDEFLGWAARETGRQLVYSSATAAREAERIELKGSVSGLPPEAAVAAVLTTTPSLQHRFAGSQLRIERTPP